MLEALKGVTPYPIVQIGWSIFEDVERAVERWIRLTGAGPFYVEEHVALSNVTHRGKATTFDHTTAQGQWGNVQLELMLQHCDNPSPIMNLCADRVSRLTSVSWFVPDLDAETRRLEAMGFPLFWSCNVWDNSRRACWFDTSSLLGCFVEVFNENPSSRKALSLWSKSAEGWNGERPIRPLSEIMKLADS